MKTEEPESKHAFSVKWSICWLLLCLWEYTFTYMSFLSIVFV